MTEVPERFDEFTGPFVDDDMRLAMDDAYDDREERDCPTCGGSGGHPDFRCPNPRCRDGRG